MGTAFAAGGVIDTAGAENYASQTVPASSSLAPQPAGKTFQIAAAILAAAALAELAAAAWALHGKLQQATTLAAAATPAPAAADQPLPRRTPAFTDPFASDVAATPAPRPPLAAASAQPEAVASLPKPTPVERPAPTAESRLTDLLDQARALRERGDTSTAIIRLHEAQAIAPNNAIVISELAVTFEKMGLADKALEQWRRLYDMGESAGIFYAAADAKLKNSQLAAAQATRDDSSGLADAERAKKEGVGLQPGAVLGLVTPTMVETSDPAAQKKFKLKIPLKARPNSSIDVSDVVIQVFFYDQLADGNIVQTNANVSSRWSTLPADWKDDDIEILEVDYTQPKPDPAQFAEIRRYYGYVIRVYYKKDLQDMRAEPVVLLKRYPPPLTLQTADAQ